MKTISRRAGCYQVPLMGFGPNERMPSNETEVEDFQTHWKERIGHESSGEGWCIEPLSLFDTLDDRGVIHFYLNLYKGGANVYYSDPFDYDYDRDEEAGAALLRMIERSLSPVRPDL